MKRVFAVTAVLALLCLSVAAHADVFNLGTAPDGTVFRNLETVAVGEPGNAGELSGSGAGGYGPDRICGAVNYTYSIGKYEVTTAQYVDFLNHKARSDPYGLYHTNMDTANDPYGCNIKRSGSDGNYSYSVASDWANRPVNYVRYWDPLRFANWLGNGQGNGDTETGAYTLGGYNGIDGRTIQRNVGAKWVLTSEDEWYKAAYYKRGSTSAGYWYYPTSSNSINTGMANYDWSVGRTTDVRSYGFSSPYGTFDQGGNVWEWNEAIVRQNANYCLRGLRGGSFGYGDYLRAWGRDLNGYPTYEGSVIGFRVSQVVPTCGINNRAAYDPIMNLASTKYNFRVWGKVTILDTLSFTVDDGSNMPVKVSSPGYSGIQTGDYASAWGAFSGEGSNRALNAQASDVVKLH